MNKSLLIITISLLVSMVSMVWVSPVHGQVYTTLYVSPPSILDTTKTPGTTFTIDINVKNVTNLYGFVFKLNYNSTVLTTTMEEFTLGNFFPSDAKLWYNETNDAEGYIWVVYTMPLGTQHGMTGSGTLATITFTVDSIGESSLDLYNTELGEYREGVAKPIAHTVYDGYFSNKPITATQTPTTLLATSTSTSFITTTTITLPTTSTSTSITTTSTLTSTTSTSTSLTTTTWQTTSTSTSQTTTVTPTAGAGPTPPWMLWIIGGLVTIVIAMTIAIALIRRKK